MLLGYLCSTVMLMIVLINHIVVDLDFAYLCLFLTTYASHCQNVNLSLFLSAADMLAQALDSLRSELTSEESRGLFIHYGGVCALLRVLQTSSGGLHTPIHLFMQLTEQSRKYACVT